MKEEFSEEELKFIAAQLRKPTGSGGIEIGERMNKGNAPMNLHSLVVLDAQPGDSILEIGMGIGKFVKNIVQLSSEIKYTGCDYSPEMVEASIKLNKLYIETNQVAFHQAPAIKMPFKDASFNKVLTINTLYFWDDHSSVIKEISRVLMPGGKLILSVRPKENMEKLPVTKYNFTKLSLDEIQSLLELGGFKIHGTTHIKEPQQDAEGMSGDRECLIIEAVVS